MRAIPTMNVAPSECIFMLHLQVDHGPFICQNCNGQAYQNER